MSKKQSYLFTAEWWKSIRVMDIQERGIAITAICELVFEGKVQEYELPEYKQQALSEILSDLEQQLERASELSRKRAKAGSVGLANRWGKQSNSAGDNQHTQDVIANDSNCLQMIANDSNCYEIDSKSIANDSNCYKNDGKQVANYSNCQKNDSKNIANDSNCYPSRARFNHQQHNNYLEDIDNNNYINNNNLDNNNYLEENNNLENNNNEETNLREKIEGWLTDSCVRMEQLCKNNGLINSSKTNDELVAILKPYIDEFINHLLASKPTEHIDRADTINHFANWMRIHKKQQDDGTPKLHIPTDEEYNEPF